MLQLRGLRRGSQLTALQISEVQQQRQELLDRRWLPGCPVVEKEERGLWLAKDSGSKFKTIYDILDDLQKWFENEECPDQYPQAMRNLYGVCHSLAGEKIRLLFIDLFSTKDEAAAEKARQELPQWIARERADVKQEQELYWRERELRARGPNVPEEQVAAKEATLQRQIAEQTRLLLQLKSKRSLWPSQFEAGAAADATGTTAQSEDASQGKGSRGDETVAGGPVAAENFQEGQTKPPGSL
jgi:hypothetical protein